MKKYIKLIVLSVVLVLIITLVTLAMIFDVDFGIFKSLSITGIQSKKQSVETNMALQTIEEIKNATAKEDLDSAKNKFDVAKDTFENIDDSTITIVQEATQEEKYFIEYLWIVLGNYADANGLDISIVTPGSTVGTSNKDSEKESDGSATSEESSQGAQNNNNNTVTAINNGIVLVVKGRYANVADFVFDVENDKSLRFKLDNIKMAYSGDNTIQATFDVLSLSVLQ